MSLASTPPRRMAAMTSAMRRELAAIASAAVGARVCTPSETVAMSGAALTSPKAESARVVDPNMASGRQPGAVCACAPVAAATRTAVRAAARAEARTGDFMGDFLAPLAELGPDDRPGQATRGCARRDEPELFAPSFPPCAARGNRAPVPASRSARARSSMVRAGRS